MNRFVIFAFFAGVAACGARTGLDVPELGDANDGRDATHFDAGLDAHDSSDADADGPIVIEPSDQCVVPDASKPALVCTKSATIGTIITQGGCINSYSVQDDEVGTIDYACDSDASTWASATFGGSSFPGSINGDFVDVCFGTVVPWQDGPECGYEKSLWSTSQRIYGDITTGSLTYTYGEKVLKGATCAIACTALATVTAP